MYRRHKNKQET